MQKLLHIGHAQLSVSNNFTKQANSGVGGGLTLGFSRARQIRDQSNRETKRLLIGAASRDYQISNQITRNELLKHDKSESKFQPF